MRKLLSVVLCLCMFTPLSITAYATSTSQQNVLTDEVLLSLTDEDFSDCFDYLLQYASQNQSCTSETLDNLALEFYAQRYREKVDTPSPQDSFYDDWSSLNSEELALGKKYPSDLAAVASAKDIATSESERRYWGGAYLGNKDAFRHASWNALMICRFYELQKVDFNVCLERARLWSTAHESGATRPSDQSASQFSVDQEMDLLNNAAGRAAAETTYTNETLALQEVQRYVDNGWCKRIKTDAQTSYLRDQMLAISTWTLRASNTAGKR